MSTEKPSQPAGAEVLDMIKEAAGRPVHDATREIAEKSRQAPRRPGDEEAFLRHKLKLLEGDRLAPAEQKEQARLRLQRLIERQVESRDIEPPPGGVGYGMFYTSGFRAEFDTGTGVCFFCCCTTVAGGNVNDYLYLTATNRASRGVEALVSYYKQSDFAFCVFDWARPESEHWQTNLPYSVLGDYVLPYGPGGRTNQTLWVINKTYQLTATGWRNDVLLFNGAQRHLDLIYRYDYTSTATEQRTGWVGSWGPIVETFQDNYQNTNDLGFFGFSLMERHVKIGDWDPGAYLPLTAD